MQGLGSFQIERPRSRSWKNFGHWWTRGGEGEGSWKLDNFHGRHIRIIPCYLLSPMLKPFGYSVSNFRMQRFSLSIGYWMRISLDLEVFDNWSIMVNFACLLKLWLSCWICLQTIIASTFSTSFWWFSSLMSKLVSTFPTSCLLHKMHSMKYIINNKALISFMDKKKKIKEWFLQYSVFYLNSATYNKQIFIQVF